MKRTAPLAAILALASASLSCDLDCTAVGCRPTVSMRIPVSMSYAEVRSSTLEVCWNDACVGGALTALPEVTLLPGEGFGTSIDGGAGADLTCMVIAWLDHLDVWCRADDRAIASGDRYRMTWTAAGGAVVAADDRAVTYAVTFPNGEACGPTCRTVAIDVAPPAQ
jgi:hypothetical protein